MSSKDADRTPPPPSDEERGVHVSRDSTGAERSGGRKRSKIGFRLQAQRREKWDDPVFDNVRVPESAKAAAPPTEQGEADAGAEKDESEEPSPGVLDRFARFFRRRGKSRST